MEQLKIAVPLVLMTGEDHVHDVKLHGGRVFQKPYNHEEFFNFIEKILKEKEAAIAQRINPEEGTGRVKGITGKKENE